MSPWPFDRKSFNFILLPNALSEKIKQMDVYFWSNICQSDQQINSMSVVSFICIEQLILMIIIWQPGWSEKWIAGN